MVWWAASSTWMRGGVRRGGRIVGARPPKLAVADHHPARLQHRTLMGGGDRAALLAWQLPGDALRDDPPSPGRGRRGEQVAGAFAAHPVVPVAVPGPVAGMVGQFG